MSAEKRPPSKLHLEKEKLEREIERTHKYIVDNQNKIETLRNRCIDAQVETMERQERIDELTEEIRKADLPAQVPPPAAPPALEHQVEALSGFFGV